MSGFDEIIAQIYSDAKSEIDKLKEDNQKEVDNIILFAKEKANGIITKTKEEAVNEQKLELEKLESKNATLVRDLELSEYQNYVSSLYDKAKIVLSNLEKEKYKEVFIPLLKSSLEDSFVANKEYTIIFAKNVSVSGEELLKDLKISCKIENSDKISSGFIISTNEFEINCSGEKLIEQQRKRTENEVYSCIFGNMEK